MEPLKVAVLGAGGRGYAAYGQFALTHPHLVKYVAVAEPEPTRMARLADAHGIPAAMRFKTWEDFIAARPDVDAVFNCLQDRLHIASAVAVLEAGYDQLLEKPIATTPQDCMRIVRAAERTGRRLAVCHVMRYSPFYQAMKDVLASGRLGDVMSCVHIENVAYWHQAHSFVRGPWSRKGESSPMILAKSCHDMDMLLYLIAKKPVRLSSFGSLTFFRPENAPAGAADRCLDGCPAEPECPYSVFRNYLGGSRPDWITNASHVTADTSREAKLEALRTGPFGRCVWKAGNDVVDHQVTNIEFEGGTTVSFLMHAFAAENTRTMRYGLTWGEIKGHSGRNEIRLTHFRDGREEVITPGKLGGGHGGGDTALMLQFIDAIREGKPMLTDISVSLDSHLLSFAAEESRLAGGVPIDLAEYRARIEKEVG